ncbi:MAG: DUF1385 domain-containing protein [Bacillota bacterium]|nr:DUF1385 domain-containing protein [Bacillota bacterium]
MAKRKSVGGQAVIEGVMMRGSKGVATAVRKPDGEIVIDRKDIIPYSKRYKILGIPIIRGFVSLIESMIIGIQTLNYSASFFEEDVKEDDKPSAFEKVFTGIFKDKSDDAMMFITFIVSMVCAFGIFFMLPNFAANLFKKVSLFNNNILLNIIEGVLRVAILILYMFLVGKLKDIKRVYQYHGAEHKTIFCYENEKELTAENASKFVRFHPRCGTNFLFLVMLVSIILFSFTKWGSLWERLLSRLILLPLISGVTYELIKWLGNSESKISKAIAFPGLMLQKLTTCEPDLSQLEVAIAALKAAEGIDDEAKNQNQE